MELNEYRVYLESRNIIPVWYKKSKTYKKYLNEFLNTKLIEYIKDKGVYKEDSTYEIKLIFTRTENAHFLACKLNIKLGTNSYVLSMNETFNNCGSLFLYDFNHFMNKSIEEVEVVFGLAELIADMFGYSNILYTDANDRIPELSKYLKEKYKAINKFKNYRMDTHITIYSKNIEPLNIEDIDFGDDVFVGYANEDAQNDDN